jgi:hypothetical protein
VIISRACVSFKTEPVNRYDPRDRYASNDLYVTVEIKVPSNITRGTYSGLVLVRGLPGVRLVMKLRVG